MRPVQAADHAAAVAEITRAISISLDVGSIFHILERQAQRILPHTMLWVLTPTPPSSMPDQWTLAFSAPRGASPGVSFDLTEASFGSSLLANQAVVTTDFKQTDAAFSLDQIIAKEGGRAGISVPIHVADRVAGCLLFCHVTPATYSPADIPLIEPVADLVALALEHERLNRQASALAVVEERNRMAREIHDTLAQSITAIILNLKALKPNSANHSPLETSILAETEALARGALTEARRSVLALNPTPLVHQSLRQALAQELARFGQRAGVATQFYIEGAEHPLTSDQITALFRIAQEALQNIFKHGAARTVLLELTFSTEAVILSIEDDGVGFAPETVPDPNPLGGSGLLGMAARARSLGGALYVDSSPGRGARVRVRLPYTFAPLTAMPLLPGDTPPASVDPIRVLIVDDHPVTRQGIRRILEDQADLLVVGEAGDGLAALENLKALSPDVVLLDLQMPNLGGLAALPRLRMACPQIEVVVLTTFDQEEHVFAALKAGARGYLLKDSAPETLLATIRAAARGEALLPTALTTRVLDRFVALAQREADPDALNDRELEVLTLIATGAPYKTIAGQLHITPKTVQYHAGNIMGKLQVRSRGEAVAVATERGLLAPRR